MLDGQATLALMTSNRPNRVIRFVFDSLEQLPVGASLRCAACVATRSAQSMKPAAAS
jgi:hypothetical protein